jgi:tyrosine-protein kinase Etk/Wzc
MAEKESSATNENETVNETSISVDGLFLFALLWRNKFIIIGFVILVGIASVIVSYNLPVQFSSTVNAIHPSTGTGLDQAFGGLSTALKDFGLTKMGGSGGEGYSFVVILDSRSLRDSLIKKFKLAERYEIPETDKALVYLALENNLDFSIEKDGNYFITAYDKDPQTAADIANSVIKYANAISQGIRDYETEEKIDYMERKLASTDSVQAVLADSLKAFSRARFVISPEQQLKDVSQALSELKSEKMKMEVLYDILKVKLGESDPQVIEQKQTIESIENKIREMKYEPGFAGNFSLDESADVALEYLKVYSEFEAFTKLKDFLLPMLEQAKIDREKEKKSLIILDEAVPSTTKARPRRSFIVGGSVIGSFILITVVILLASAFRLLKQRYAETFNRS